MSSSGDAPSARPSADAREQIRGVISNLLPIFLALAIVAALYWQILSFQFSIVDDGMNVFHNQYIDNPQAQNIRTLWTHGYYALYMPLTYTIWAICARVAPFPVAHPVPPGGANSSVLNPASFHAASLLLHLGVVAVVYGICRRMRIAPWPSAAGALFYAIHPVQVQSVAWITGMNNLTGGFFGLLALLLYLHSVQDDSGRGHKNVRTLLYVAATCAFVAAVLSKPTATIIPFFGVLFEVIYFRRPFRTWAAGLGFWLVPALACGIANSMIGKRDNAAVWSPLWGRPFVVGDSLAFGITKLLLPFELTVDYGRSPRNVLGHWWGYVTWLVPAAVFYAYSLSRKRLDPNLRNNVLLGGLLFVTGLLPTVGIVPYYTQAVSSVSDRYLYLGLLGPAIIVATILGRPTSARRFALAIWICAMLLYTAQTIRLLPLWKDMNTLTDSMVVSNPNSWMAHGNAGIICGARGDLPCALREFSLEAELEQPKAAAPSFFEGVTLTEMGRFEDAIRPLSDAFEMSPADDEMTYQLWNALAYLRRMDEAQAVLARHLRLRPGDGRAQLNMGKMLVSKGDMREALPYLQRAEGLLPKEPAVEFFLGTAYEQMNQIPDAVVHYRRAAELDPGREEIRAAIERLNARK